MGKRTTAVPEVDLNELVSSIVHDCGTLAGQQVDLLRSEVGREIQRAGGAVLSMAAGGGLAAAGGLLSGLALAHLLHRATGLPLWSCYGAAAGVCGVAGAALMRSGGRQIAGVRLLPPPQTTAALEENLTWAKEQLTPAGR